MRLCATHVSSVYRVLDTPPLPATHPRFGNRWHHTRLDHLFFPLCLAVKLATSCRNNARGEPRPEAEAKRTLEGVGWTRLILIEAPSSAYPGGMLRVGHITL
jgi:hypothetical protein